MSAANSVSFVLDVRKEGLEPIMASAYLLTDRCYARLDGDRARKIKVTLSGKTRLSASALRKLSSTFRRELSTQKLRWAIARNNLPVREFIAEQAVLLANGKSAAPAPEAVSDQLSDDQRKEIDRLIAEVEAEIEQINKKKTRPDPKKIAVSWEEKQEKRAVDPS